jgi:hypothetical protein
MTVPADPPLTPEQTHLARKYSGHILLITHPDDAGTVYLRDVLDDYLRVRAQLATLKAPQWQPIYTAPRDGTRILIYQPPNAYAGSRGRCRLDSEINVVRWHQPANPAHAGFWMPSHRPSHWMPLPEEPR